MADLLDMGWINKQQHPLWVQTLNSWWPVHDLDVETGLIRIDVCGMLDVIHVGSIFGFRDGNLIEYPVEALYSDAIPEEREPLAQPQEAAR